MTGFGAAERAGFRVEIRSLNHRHIEISTKMPSFLVENDMAIRNLIKERFQRGKFDVYITLTDKQKYKIKTNLLLAKELFNAFADLKSEMSIEEPPNLNHLLIFREIILSESIDYSPDDLLNAVKDAIANLKEMRLKEALVIKKDMAFLLDSLRQMQKQIEFYSKELIFRQRDNLRKKISELLLPNAVDETRLLQEIAFIAQKSNINEELIRLKSHIEHLELLLSGEESIGRKFDFILQEILRETNTIASKTDFFEVINIIIEMKTQIEKLREQAQNLQ